MTHAVRPSPSEPKAREDSLIALALLFLYAAFLAVAARLMR